MGKMNLKVIGICALVLGALYIIIGASEVLFDPILFGVESAIPSDLFGGLALLVIGGVYLYGVRDLWNNRREGISFFIGGAMLSAIFGIIFLLIMGADGLMYLLGEAEEFSVIAEFRPEIWLFFISLPAAYLVWKGEKLWRQ
jgi:hypothetical protein